MGGHTAVVSRLECHNLCRISVGVLRRYVSGVFSVIRRKSREGDWLQDRSQRLQQCACMERQIESGWRRESMVGRSKIRMVGIDLTVEMSAKGWRLHFSGCGLSDGESG